MPMFALISRLLHRHSSAQTAVHYLSTQRDSLPNEPHGPSSAVDGGDDDDPTAGPSNRSVGGINKSLSVSIRRI